MNNRQLNKLKNKAKKLGDKIWIDYINNINTRRLFVSEELRSLNFDLNYLIKIHKKYGISNNIYSN